MLWVLCRLAGWFRVGVCVWFLWLVVEITRKEFRILLSNCGIWLGRLGSGLGFGGDLVSLI